MLKALGSKIRLDSFDTDVSVEYFALVGDILYSEPVQALSGWSQHMHIDRLRHSVNVSYYSYRLCKKWGLDYRAAARGGLLHDLFFFDWRQLPAGSSHIKFHPLEALRNAERLTGLTDRERDIIAKHMWPCGGRARFRETLVVSLVDKLSALTEIADYFRLRFAGLGCQKVPAVLGS